MSAAPPAAETPVAAPPAAPSAPVVLPPVVPQMMPTMMPPMPMGGLDVVRLQEMKTLADILADRAARRDRRF